MQLDLTRFRQPHTHISRTFLAEEVAREGDAYRLAGPVHLELDVHKDKEVFRLSGTARAELELLCSRCLEPFGMPVDAVFDLKYLPATEMATDEEREIQDEDFETSYYRDDRIDVNDLLREQFYLQLPMKPLCREECQGLCPECGTNRNTGACDCAPGWEDPRMAPLRGLARSKRDS